MAFSSIKLKGVMYPPRIANVVSGPQQNQSLHLAKQISSNSIPMHKDAKLLSFDGEVTRRSRNVNYWDDITFVYAGSVAHPEAILKPGTNEKVHPTQMPVGLAARCILFSTNAGDLVPDPFSGSGTTSVACIKLARRFIGIERETEYVKLPLDRWAKVRLQPSLYQTKKVYDSKNICDYPPASQLPF